MTKTTDKPTTVSVLFGRLSLSLSSVVRLFYAALALFVVSTVLLLSALATEHRIQQVPSSQAHQGYKIGTRLSSGVADMTLRSVRYETGEGVYQTAGKTYAIVTLQIKNRSDQPIYVIPTTDTYIKDGGNVARYITPYKLDSPFHAGSLPPGETIEGQLSYLVPTTGTLRFYVDARWSGTSVGYAIRP